MGKRSRHSKSIMLSGQAANLMLDIWHAAQNAFKGTPVKLTQSMSGLAVELEKAGLIERHYVGSAVGAIVTPLGRAFVSDAIKHFKTN